MSKIYQKFIKNSKGCCSGPFDQKCGKVLKNQEAQRIPVSIPYPRERRLFPVLIFLHFSRENERNYSSFLWFNSTLTYCKLHNFSGTFVFHVRCRLFLWKILKYEVCNSLGSYLCILLKIHQTSYFNSDSITARSNIIKKP